jgi:hypothetical protein
VTGRPKRHQISVGGTRSFLMVTAKHFGWRPLKLFGRIKARECMGVPLSLERLPLGFER